MQSNSIVYFEREGRENLPAVLKVLKRVLRKRPELRTTKLVIFTAFGEGPALAYTQLQEFEPKIVAVTFPPTFFVTRGDERLSPRIPPKLRSFFSGVGIPVITGRLPFDQIDGADAHNSQMKLIQDVITIFGGSFGLCIQAVLQCCDSGLVELGEKVIAVSGDCAAIVTASTTSKFLSRDQGLSVNEIFCKPRFLSIARTTPATTRVENRDLFERPGHNLGPESPKPLLKKGQS